MVEEAHQLEAAAQVRQEAREALRTATRCAEEAKAAALEALAFDSGVEGRAHDMHASFSRCLCARVRVSSGVVVTASLHLLLQHLSVLPS